LKTSKERSKKLGGSRRRAERIEGEKPGSEDGDSKFLRNIGGLLPDYTALPQPLTEMSTRNLKKKETWG
jgi:hypothetical protein